MELYNIMVKQPLFPKGNPIRIFEASPEENFYKPAEKIKKIIDTEVVSNRAVCSKTFKNNDGSFTTVIDRAPVHYLDENGSYQEIDLTVVDNGARFTMNKAPYSVEIYKDKVGYKFSRPSGEFFSIELVKIAGVNVNNTNIVAKSDFNQVFWDGVDPKVLFKVVLNPQKPKLNTFIVDATANRSLTWLISTSSQFNFESYGFDSENSSTEIITEKIFIDPNNFYYNETWTGRISRVVKLETRQKVWFNDPVYPVIIDPTITEQIPANGNDGASSPGGNAFNASATQMGRSTKALSGGFRFTTVGVPVGATISSATLKLKINTVTSGISAGNVYGANYDNVAIWETAAFGFNPNSATKTTAVTNWAPVASSVNNITVTSQVAEIVARGGWAEDNAMAMIATWVNVSPDYKYVAFSDYSVSPANSAILEIVYTTSGGGATPGPVPQIITW